MYMKNIRKILINPVIIGVIAILMNIAQYIDLEADELSEKARPVYGYYCLILCVLHIILQ